MLWNRDFTACHELETFFERQFLYWLICSGRQLYTRSVNTTQEIFFPPSPGGVRGCITDPMYRYVRVYYFIATGGKFTVNGVRVESNACVDERIRDSRRIVIDELVSEMNITNGAETLYCEVVGRWTRSI